LLIPFSPGDVFMKFKLSAAALIAAGLPALAADLPARTAPPPPAPPSASATPFRMPTLVHASQGLWNGVYVGGAVSWDLAARDTEMTGPSGTSVTGALTRGDAPGVEGFGAGLYAGYNMQFGDYVAGVEADATALLDPWGDRSTNSFKSTTTDATGAFTATARAKRLGDSSLRLRAGYVIMRDMLVYATGGVALTQVERNWTMGGSITVPGTNGGAATTYSLADASGKDEKYRLGWTIGAGLDYMVLPDWTVRAEYRYTSFGETKANLSSACSTSCGTATSALRFTDTVHSVRLGVAYHFGGPTIAPISVRY
jgi:outer membrane immunogenic protein